MESLLNMSPHVLIYKEAQSGRVGVDPPEGVDPLALTQNLL